MTIIKKYLSLSIVVKYNKIQKVCILKNKLNFPEELLYENIAKSMGERENFIANRGSIFPHGKVEDIEAQLKLPKQNNSDEDLKKYLATLPNTFDEWFK